MFIVSALNWRYASKRMNGTKVPKAKMDVISTALTGNNQMAVIRSTYLTNSKKTQLFVQ